MDCCGGFARGQDGESCGQYFEANRTGRLILGIPYLSTLEGNKNLIKKPGPMPHLREPSEPDFSVHRSVDVVLVYRMIQYFFGPPFLGWDGGGGLGLSWNHFRAPMKLGTID